MASLLDNTVNDLIVLMTAITFGDLFKVMYFHATEFTMMDIFRSDITNITSNRKAWEN